MFLLLLVRVLSLQMLDMGRGAEFLKHQGALRTVRSAELPAYRGVITDRRGEPLAVSTPVISLWANPPLLPASGRLAELAAALQVDEDELARALARYATSSSCTCAATWSPDRGAQGARTEYRRRAPQREYRRYYPAGEVASQLVGLTNLDGRGVAGIELAYDSWLRGHTGKKRYIKDLHGEAVRDIGVVEPARPGRNLQLSIDLRLQTLQHRELSGRAGHGRRSRQYRDPGRAQR
jgi:cell division protein FtsI (penicillin-binding protein 3)